MGAWPLMIGYLVGSIPFAWLLVYLTTGSDLRRVGSGNVGAANALRTTRWKVGVLVALLDVAKGSAAVWLAALADGGTAARALGGLAAVVGHVFPVWLRFRGGKGVATTGGVFAVLAPGAALAAAAAFLSVVWLTRLVSVGSLSAAVALVAVARLGGSPLEVQVVAASTALLVVLRHVGNISRLTHGRERRLGHDEGFGGGPGPGHRKGRGA